MQNQTDDQKRLQSHVDSIANGLSEGITWGDTYDETDLEWLRAEHGDHLELTDHIRGFDYLEDVLDIHYIVNSDAERSFRSAKILVAFGGPNIWVCFDDLKVKGYWWGDYAEASFDGVFADEVLYALRELYTC